MKGDPVPSRYKRLSCAADAANRCTTMSWRDDVMRHVITCRFCGRPIGSAYYEVFDHVGCAPLTVETPSDSVPAEAQEIRQLEKSFRRRQRWLDRHAGKCDFWA
jgi:hypothetical protein